MKATKPLNLILSILLLIAFHSSGQELGIGQWRDHLPYNHVIAVAEAGNRIYAATPYALFYIDQNDNSLNRLTKVNGLSDVGISSIKFSKQHNTLVIAYTNANIDLLKDDKVINLSDIKRKPILGNKSINRIVFINDLAYLACGFGIVVLDVNKEEFPEPIYYLGNQGGSINVHDITYNPVDSTIYAASESGVFRANYFSANLANYAEWTPESSLMLPAGPFNHIAAFNNRIYLNQAGPSYATDKMFVKINNSWQEFEPEIAANRFSVEVHYDRLVVTLNLAVDVYKPDGTKEYRIYTYNPGTVTSKDAIIDENNNVWIGDEFEGLAKVSNIWNSQKYQLNGPNFPDVFALSSAENDVWVVPGGRRSSFEGIYRPAQFAGFVDGSWRTINERQDPFLSDFRDVLSVAVNPANPKNVFLGTWGYGLLEYTNGEFVNRYTSENSSLQSSVLMDGWIAIGGLAFDNNNNLWVVNSSASSMLSMKKPSGEWKSYSLGSNASGIEGTKIVIDQLNQKWILGRNLNLIVFTDNNTPDNTADDITKRLSSAVGQGALQGSFVRSIAVDHEGLVWVGTDKGVVVFYSPENIFTNQNFDAQQVLIEQDGYGQYLLETETVTAIAIDGSNRKWIGTDRAGVFLMSPDGTKQILHFTEENSPLLSNSISDITITKSGEVFIGTSRGLISYQSESVPVNPTLDEVVIYPNPVRESFTGSIAIKGLVENSSVKITDIAGNIVHSAKAEGGLSLWNRYNFDGTKAKTGVYLVYITNPDGSITSVSKIMIIN